MKLENDFTVPASIDEAWAFLLDVPRVAPCLPGASVEPETDENGSYKGTMKLKIGPITAQYKGTVKIQEADKANHKVSMRAQAKDARGQGSASATITSTMEETPEGTKVSVVTDMRVTGPAAQFGRGVMQDVSAKLMKRFADCLAEQLSGGTAASEVETAEAKPTDTPKTEDAGVPSASSGVSSAEAETKVPDASSGAPTSTTPPPRQAEDVLDLGEAAGGAVLKRALPLVGGVVALLVLIRIIRK
ncbi:SRPBCC family protein [Solirubrobacter phytolaccae]|uniref:SRPBCC family protein n=1 Tax=Solirubrobacter phytolaccae TaxID=1404360 RepID=A0A9X3NJG8_9ACTN|nr:SRPBCC family protein [Solirubrobacter phytolaccae]MDA0184661.1 SRPBCC family protein [Solirubrobacter phytolaccae]